jgi:hypothetical protein
LPLPPEKDLGFGVSRPIGPPRGDSFRALATTKGRATDNRPNLSFQGKLGGIGVPSSRARGRDVPNGHTSRDPKWLRGACANAANLAEKGRIVDPDLFNEGATLASISHAAR